MQDLGQIFESYTALYQSVFPDTGDSILFVDDNMQVLLANEHASELFGLPPEDLVGMDWYKLISQNDRCKLDQIIDGLKDTENWAGEQSCLGYDGRSVPVDMTIKKFLWDNRLLYCINLRDLTDYKLLREQISQEKANRREMYVTMRNLMKAFNREKTGFEKNISYKIETLLLPMLDKIKRETSVNLRNTFLNIMRDQLIGLTKGFGTELDARFLMLTRAEIKICRLIQSGHSGKEIAQKLNISFETIQTHRKNIRNKLGLRGRKVNLYALLSDKSFFTNHTV
jgi:PAS domain S-box-containing protein